MDMKAFHSSIHIAPPPSSPKMPDSCNPARRIQLKNHTKPKEKKLSREDSDDRSDSYYSDILNSDSDFESDSNIDKSVKVHLPPSKPQKPSSFSISINPKSLSSPPSSPSRLPVNKNDHAFHNELEIFRNKNDKNDTIDIDKESDDISLFLKADLHPPIPMIKPPTHDSAIRSFLRLLISSKLFHVTQLKQKEGKQLPLVKIPKKLPPFSIDQIETCYLIADFVNDLNKETDLSQFFFEMYLDAVEYAFQEEDPILDRMEFPFEVAEDEYIINEEEQVKCVLSLADRLLDLQIKNVLKL